MLSVIILSGGLVTCTKNMIEKEKDKSCDLSSLVAGGGLEPPTSGL